MKRHECDSTVFQRVRCAGGHCGLGAGRNDVAAVNARGTFGAMKWALLATVVALGDPGLARAAEDPFSRTVPPGEFSAAGLGKLSAEELARLDALVRDYKSGALEAARREAAAAARARAEAEARATKAEAQARVADTESKKADRSLLARAKVLLTPGTEIEYSTVESRIVGDFKGWDGKTLFTLENGQRWQAEGGSYVTPPISRPAVKITPGALGSFWMKIEGVDPRVKVKIVGGAK